jgi:catechol 2,3-dioxygenase-like lactoylglutathione lyase family enzyme
MIDHLTANVSDFDSAKRFYEQALVLRKCEGRERSPLRVRAWNAPIRPAPMSPTCRAPS